METHSSRVPHGLDRGHGCVFDKTADQTGCGASSSSAAPVPLVSASHAVTPAESVVPASAGTVQGQVLEAIDSGNYTYVRVKTDGGEIWAATLKFKVAVGDTVVVPLENPMRDFHSQTLKRDFPLVYFSSAITTPGQSARAQASGLPPGHPPTTAAAATPESMVAAEPNEKLIALIAPPSGGVSIANVWANRKSLAGKTVTIRGKVVKYNPAIMGLNWLHVQDGSES
jgi:hypothetical protein